MIRDFEHFAPKTLEEALTLLDKYGDDCKVIAGGQSLLILMKQGLVAPPYMIDIKNIAELNYINSASGGLQIGALTPHRIIENSPLMTGPFRILAEMENRLASVQTRNWGTIGGNLCHGDPAGDPAPSLMVLDATVTTASVRGERNMPLADFYLDYFETALESGELLTEIHVPAPAPNTGAVYQKFNIIDTDMATVGVAVAVTLKPGDGICEDVRIALGASAPTAMRAKQAEAVLKGKKITDALLKEAGEAASAEAEPISDISATDEYRREVIKALVARLGNEALARAKQG